MTASDRRGAVVKTLAQQRLLPIIRATDSGTAVDRGRRLVEAGFTLLEISLTTPSGVDAIAELVRTVPAHVAVGAGTVLRERDVAAVHAAGGRFVVAPNVNASVIAAAHEADMAAFPGAFSPTEIVLAVRANADAVKLFPAITHGLAGFAAIRPALPDVAFIATGGIKARDALSWLHAGVLAVGLGSDLASLTSDETTSLRMAAGAAPALVLAAPRSLP